MTKYQFLKIERESALTYAFGTMNIVIDDAIGIKLANGESANVKIPQNKKECTLQVKDHIFKVPNIKQVKKIIVKFSIVGVQCSILYKNQNRVEALNKNPGADVTKTIWIIILMFLILIPLLRESISLFLLY